MLDQDVLGRLDEITDEQWIDYLLKRWKRAIVERDEARADLAMCRDVAARAATRTAELERFAGERALEQRVACGLLGRIGDVVHEVAHAAGIPDGMPEERVVAMGRALAARAEALKFYVDGERKARAAVQIATSKRDDVWIWQGDGTDEPATLSCPVVMSADTLREMLATEAAMRTALARLRHLVDRAVCRCLFADCGKHGAYHFENDAEYEWISKEADRG